MKIQPMTYSAQNSALTHRANCRSALEKMRHSVHMERAKKAGLRYLDSLEGDFDSIAKRIEDYWF